MGARRCSSIRARSIWGVQESLGGAGAELAGKRTGAFSIFQRFATDGTNSTARGQGYKVEFEVDHNGGRLRAKNVTGVGGVALVAPPRSFYRGSGKHEPCPGKPKRREKSETRGL
ncbi:hypothetical protein BE221DRAFT_3341 [Ostreococcus tauri]|uniref:Uncharacterized protein n=1 Tax=Ostreococcus tauri TaxID=70448 RepID=A0A1Y5HY88_OSTTA|nr:hypothetical protein BE221DRAFT_3341 [Ostreococcus tauri]